MPGIRNSRKKDNLALGDSMIRRTRSTFSRSKRACTNGTPSNRDMAKLKADPKEIPARESSVPLHRPKRYPPATWGISPGMKNTTT
jgi:hypothetical protein